MSKKLKTVIGISTAAVVIAVLTISLCFYFLLPRDLTDFISIKGVKSIVCTYEEGYDPANPSGKRTVALNEEQIKQALAMIYNTRVTVVSSEENANDNAADIKNKYVIDITYFNGDRIWTDSSQIYYRSVTDTQNKSVYVKGWSQTSEKIAAMVGYIV